MRPEDLSLHVLACLVKFDPDLPLTKPSGEMDLINLEDHQPSTMLLDPKDSCEGRARF